MTEEELKALPWYGGNKIPASYLAKFSLPIPPEEEGMPSELRQFLTMLGASNRVPTSLDVDDTL